MRNLVVVLIAERVKRRRTDDGGRKKIVRRSSSVLQAYELTTLVGSKGNGSFIILSKVYYTNFPGRNRAAGYKTLVKDFLAEGE